MVSIITCAYNSAKFAEEHVKSILQQKGEWLHYVGVDGCEETLKAYKKLKHSRMRLFSIPENKGKAFMQNTLVSIARGNILLFDSDDFMSLVTIENLPTAPGENVYRLSMLNSNENILRPATAILYMHSDIYLKMGGFRTDIKCTHDTCFSNRYEKLTRKEIITLKNIQPFIRNRHPESLTMHPDTGLKSLYRKQARQKIDDDIYRGKLQIPYIQLDKITEWI